MEYKSYRMASKKQEETAGKTADDIATEILDTDWRMRSASLEENPSNRAEDSDI